MMRYWRVLVAPITDKNGSEIRPVIATIMPQQEILPDRRKVGRNPPIGHPAAAGYPDEIDGVFLKAPYFRTGAFLIYPNYPIPPLAMYLCPTFASPTSFFFRIITPRWPWAGKGTGEMKTGKTGEMAM